MVCEHRKLCFKFSLGLVVMDQGLESEASKESWVAQNLPNTLNMGCNFVCYTVKKMIRKLLGIGN